MASDTDKASIIIVFEDQATALEKPDTYDELIAFCHRYFRIYEHVKVTPYVAVLGQQINIHQSLYHAIGNLDTIKLDLTYDEELPRYEDDGVSVHEPTDPPSYEAVDIRLNLPGATRGPIDESGHAQNEADTEGMGALAEERAGNLRSSTGRQPTPHQQRSSIRLHENAVHEQDQANTAAAGHEQANVTTTSTRPVFLFGRHRFEFDGATALMVCECCNQFMLSTALERFAASYQDTFDDQPLIDLLSDPEEEVQWENDQRQNVQEGSAEKDVGYEDWPFPHDEAWEGAQAEPAIPVRVIGRHWYVYDSDTGFMVCECGNAVPATELELSSVVRLASTLEAPPVDLRADN